MFKTNISGQKQNLESLKAGKNWGIAPKRPIVATGLLQTTAHGPNPAREAILSGRKEILSIMKK